jgi:prophage regulatory protein
MNKSTSGTSSNPVGLQAQRLLRRRQIEQLFGISRSTIYARLDPNSKQYDPAFPKPIHLNMKSGTSGSIAWVESEAQAYIAHLIASSRSPA